jgi:pimeloyl-ACP methyl ester carboxylesterase
MSEIKTADKITIELHRRPAAEPSREHHQRTVLLLHGASASHETFTIAGVGLAHWLTKNHFDTWLLDWRGSNRVVRARLTAKAGLGENFNFNAAAEHDVPAALREMKRAKVKEPIAVLGHCMGGGVLAESVARGFVNDGAEQAKVDRIVLLTLGLFYETPIDSRVKSEERLLERLISANGTAFDAMDPTIKGPGDALQNAWPSELDNFYQQWPVARFHADGEGAQPVKELCEKANHMCNRLSFMYGMPYHHDNLVPEIHGEVSKNPILQNQFGPIPAHMFSHASQNVREGHATVYRRPGEARTANSEFGSDRMRRNFTTPLKSVTLITGALNRLWHRNSIDLMYEWLMRDTANCCIEKYVLPNYGHQDLLWGKRAPADVFPIIRRGLRGDALP